MPVCTKCGIEKGLTSFYRDRRAKHGRKRHCKICHRKMYGRKSPAERRAYIRERRATKEKEAAYKRSIRKTVRKWRYENPTKSKAQDIIIKRVRRGRIKRAVRCEVCGKMRGSVNLIAHHFDYARPLYLVWCHRQCHVLLNAGELSVPFDSLAIAEMREREQQEVKYKGRRRVR